MSDFLTAVAHVNSGWSIAAFAIAAVLGVLNRVLSAPDAVKRRGRTPPAILTNALVWPLVAAICFLGALPILASTYIESMRVRGSDFYRIRVVVLGPDGNPVSGAVLRTNASNETTSTSQ